MTQKFGESVYILCYQIQRNYMFSLVIIFEELHKKVEPQQIK